MLQDIRDKSQGWIAKTIIGLIVVLLALTGVEALFNTSASDRTVAEVNGEIITASQLRRAMDRQRAQLQQQFGNGFDVSQLSDEMLFSSVISGIIDRTLLMQAAREADFSFTQAMVDRVILETPEFQTDGQFDPLKYDRLLTNMGYSRMQFRQRLGEDMLLNQLRAGIGGTEVITDQQIQTHAALEKQTRDFALHFIQVDPETISPAAEQIQQYYDENIEQFHTPEKVSLNYIQLRQADFADSVDVDEEQLEKLYQQQIAPFKGGQRRAAHILLETGEQRSNEEAKQQLNTLRQQLSQGESDFAQLAKEFSEDPGSAEAGGDLGFAGRGVYATAFEEVLYSLKPGEVSTPVQTEFGWHLVKLLDERAANIPSLESLRPELVQQLKAPEMERLFVEARKELETLAYESTDLEYPAQQLGLTVKTTEPFSREGGPEGLVSNPQIVQAAFEPAVLEEGLNSGVLELDPQTVVVVHLKQHQPPKPRPLDEVQEEITKNLRTQQARDQARDQGEALLAQLVRGEVDAQPDWQVKEAVTRTQADIEPALLKTLFQMPRPAVSESAGASYQGLSLSDGRYAIIRLDGVNEPVDLQLDPQEKERYRSLLGGQIGQQTYQAYMARLRAQADIERP